MLLFAFSSSPETFKAHCGFQTLYFWTFVLRVGFLGLPTAVQLCRDVCLCRGTRLRWPENDTKVKVPQ